MFDPHFQAGSLEAKIVVAMERLAEVFRVLLWEAGKSAGLSPLQVQILTFCAHHDSAMCRVQVLAREFNMTRPTISDAVRVLVEKGYLHRLPDPKDARSHSLIPTNEGVAWVRSNGDMMGPLFEAVRSVDAADRQRLFRDMLQLIATLQKAGLISMHRMCFTCQHYRTEGGQHYCRLLQTTLAIQDLRIDCPEHRMAEV